MTAILGKGALLNCRVRGIGNRTVCIAQNSIMKRMKKIYIYRMRRSTLPLHVQIIVMMRKYQSIISPWTYYSLEVPLLTSSVKTKSFHITAQQDIIIGIVIIIITVIIIVIIITLSYDNWTNYWNHQKSFSINSAYILHIHVN